MKEEIDGIYDKPKFGKIVALFAVTLLLCLIAALVFFRTGHPDMHTQPQPKNNKGSLEFQQKAAPTTDAALLPRLA